MGLTARYGGFVIAAVATMLLGSGRAAVADVDLVTPEQAIERVIAQRLGGEVAVDVTALQTAVRAERALQALPEPGGRAGARMRFVMMAGRSRRGVAVATVKVIGSYARAARAIARNEGVTADAVEIVQGELPSMGLQRLPATEELIGLTARRDIAAGEALTQAVVQVPPFVRSGDTVDLTVIVGTVRVNAKAIASGSGYQGDVVRVTPRGGRPLRARIVGRGRVEVVQ
jgi:flagellar basal body P-ring formation protein FlgA